MSTVLWSHRLKDGEVVSDSSDLYALFRHLGRLDRLCRALGLPLLSSMCDHTDLEVNLGRREMPDGMEDTNELMAVEGTWVEASEAVQVMERLAEHIRAESIRFGWLKDEREMILEELALALAFAEAAQQEGASFAFAVVM